MARTARSVARLERVVEAADLVRSSIGATPNFAGVANQLAFDTNQPPRFMLLKGMGRVLGGADSVSFVAPPPARTWRRPRLRPARADLRAVMESLAADEEDARGVHDDEVEAGEDETAEDEADGIEAAEDETANTRRLYVRTRRRTPPQRRPHGRTRRRTPS